MVHVAHNLLVKTRLIVNRFEQGMIYWGIINSWLTSTQHPPLSYNLLTPNDALASNNLGAGTALVRISAS